MKTTVAKWIFSTLSTIAHCHNDRWPDEMVCADKRPPSWVLYSLYLFQGIRETNTSPLVLKAHKSCFNWLVSPHILSDKALGFYSLSQLLFGWLLCLHQNNSFIDQYRSTLQSEKKVRVEWEFLCGYHPDSLTYFVLHVSFFITDCSCLVSLFAPGNMFFFFYFLSI